MDKSTGLRRFHKATVYSWYGMKAAYTQEPAFRYEVWMTLAALPIATWLANSALQFALLVGSLLSILIVELLNSAIEAAVDRGGPEFHELAGRAKDMGSAAVFFTLVLCALIWVCVLFENWSC